MAKSSQVFCVYNKQNTLVAVGTSPEDVWTSALKTSSQVGVLQTYFNMLDAGYYMELGFIVDKAPV